MRRFIFAALSAAAVVCAACGGNSATVAGDGANRAATAAPTPAAQTTLAHGPSSSSGAVPPVASGHAPPPPSSAPAAPPPGGAGTDTTALDARIEKAVAKVKAPNATAADKQAAAAAYLERGNVFWGAGVPALYKRALADFNSVLLYQPDNAEAQTKKAEIVRIYQSMGRPVPDYSNEQ